MSSKLKKFSVYPPIMMLSLYFAVFSYMVPIMKESFSMTYTQVGAISTVQSVGGAIAQLVCFGVFAALNKSRIILFSLIGVALSLMWLGFNNVLVMLYVLFFVRGFFGNTSNTLSNALVTDVFESRKEFFVGLYHSLAALAAVVGPYLVLWLGNDFTVSFEVTAAIIALSAVLFWLGMRDEIRKPMVANKANFGGILKLFRLLKQRNMVLVMLIALFCSFAQNTIVIYISSFGMEIAGIKADGAFALSMFLFGLFAGSLLYSLVAGKLSTIKIMLYANIFALASIVGMLVCQSAMAVGILALAGGLFLGANMPGLFVELAKMVPEDSGAVSALLFLGSIIACLAAPVIVGAIADEIGMRLALLISTISFVPVLYLVFLWKRKTA